MDPNQPTRFEAQAYAILTFYLVFCVLYAAITWDNWWRENRYFALAHVVDICVFAVMVFITDGYTSPFFTFFAFVLLSSTIRWSWRQTAVTAAAVIVLFMVASVAAFGRDGDLIETTRVLYRTAYLFVLSVCLVWFGVNQRGNHVRDGGRVEPLDKVNGGAPPLRAMLEYARARARAKRALLVISDREEPWIELATLDGSDLSVERTGSADPIVLPTALDGKVFLFDLHRRRALVRDRDRAVQSSLRDDLVSPQLAQKLRSKQGLAVGFQTETHAGVMFLMNVPGLCADDLDVGADIQQALSEVVERSAAVNASEAAAATRTRLALARDLHDSVVQLLAGTAFRLEGVRRSVESGRDATPDIVQLQQELSTEQRELRAFIGQLRGNERLLRSPGVRGGLQALLERQRRQWGVEVELVQCPESLTLPASLDQALHQLVREGVANAVRHGKATYVSISVNSGRTGVSLVIADNGRGFSVKPDAAGEPGAKIKPWSLNERVQALNGHLSLYSSPEGSRIIISLPFEAQA